MHDLRMRGRLEVRDHGEASLVKLNIRSAEAIGLRVGGRAKGGGLRQRATTAQERGQPC